MMVSVCLHVFEYMEHKAKYKVKDYDQIGLNFVAFIFFMLVFIEVPLRVVTYPIWRPLIWLYKVRR